MVNRRRDEARQYLILLPTYKTIPSLIYTREGHTSTQRILPEISYYIYCLHYHLSLQSQGCLQIKPTLAGLMLPELNLAGRDVIKDFFR